METTAELEAVFLSGQPLSPVKRVQPQHTYEKAQRRGTPNTALTSGLPRPTDFLQGTGNPGSKEARTLAFRA